MRVLVGFGFFLLMLGVIFALAEENALNEGSILAAFGLDTADDVLYQNEAGAVISFERFSKLLVSGKAASLIKSDGNTSILRLTTPQSQPAAPTSFPSLDLVDLDGNAVRDVDLRGRELLVNFFYADCAPCIEEVPALNEFARRHPDIGVLAITFDESEIATQFAKDHGFEWPIVPNAENFIDKAGVYGFPTHVLIDAEGHLVGMKSGVSKGIATERTVVEHIESLVTSLRKSSLNSNSNLVPRQ